MAEAERQQFAARNNSPQRSRIDEWRGLDRARIADENDDIVEVVVIPVASEPRRVRRVGVGGRHQPQESGHENNGAQCPPHSAMIARGHKMVKRLFEMSVYFADASTIGPSGFGTPPSTSSVTAKTLTGLPPSTGGIRCAPRPEAST